MHLQRAEREQAKVEREGRTETSSEEPQQKSAEGLAKERRAGSGGAADQHLSDLEYRTAGPVPDEGFRIATGTGGMRSPSGPGATRKFSKEAWKS